LQQYDRLLEAEALLLEALAIDPAYIDALALLVDVYYAGQRSDPDFEQRRFLTIEKILAVDPDNPSIKARLAWEQWQENRNLVGTARLLQEAAATDPYDFNVLFVGARTAAALSRTDQAIRLGEYLASRDPLHFWTQLNLAQYLFEAGRYEDAFSRFEVAISLNDSAGNAHWKIGLSRLMLGDAEGALRDFENESGPEYRMHGMALAYHDLGRMADSIDLIGILERESAEYWPFGLARAYAWIDDADAAFKYLEATAETQWLLLAGAATNPLLAKLHDDARWLPFLESVGISPGQLAEIELTVEPPGT
jgi:tetratricopeptide (TPR) repeat protein